MSVSSPGSTGPAQRSGMRNPITGARSLTPSGGKGRRRFVQLLTAHGPVVLLASRPFTDVPILICAQDVTAKDGSVIPRGAVLIRNETLGRRKDTEPVWIVYEKGLFAALRGQGLHASRGYRREIAKLTIAAEELPIALRLSWMLPGNASVNRAAYETQLGKILARFLRDLDPLKVEARAQLEAAITVTDRLGRFNPPAMSARIGAASRRVADRVEIAHFISNRVDARRMALCVVHARLWSMIWDLFLEVARDDERFNTDRDYPFKRVAIANRLRRLADRFALIDIAPYGTHAFPHEVEDLRLAAKACVENRAGAFHAATGRMLRSIEFLKVHRRIEEVLVLASLAKDEGETLSDADAKNAVHFITECIAELALDPHLDRGFKKKIQKDVVLALNRALDDVRMGKSRYLYQDLSVAAKCF